MSEDGLDDFRERLKGRVDDCWDRLDDAVSELTSLHGIAPDDVLARVRAVLDRERER